MLLRPCQENDTIYDVFRNKGQCQRTRKRLIKHISYSINQGIKTIELNCSQSDSCALESRCLEKKGVDITPNNISGICPRYVQNLSVA